MKNGLIACLFIVTGLGSSAQAQSEVGHHWDGSRTTPLHSLRLMDEENEVILPAYRDAMPFSVKNTCGTCHEYATVNAGLHFNASQPDVPAGRPGEPWVWVNEKLGTQLPLSYRGWPGTWNPQDIGMTPWRFTQLFGRHLPGGDVAEPRDIIADPNSRWDVSGIVEINCMGCHNAGPNQDLSEWAKQLGRENFRWAATAASGLGKVGGMASRMPDMWTLHDGKNPDDLEFAVPPSVTYDSSQFAPGGRALFDIAYQPPDKNCLQCHSASTGSKERWELDADIHTAAGMKCADCHRNGLDHNMIRGYEYEVVERDDPTVAEFSCRGCHLGLPDLENQSLMAAMGGRMGAPRPEHKGLPAIHLEKLSCTACHSGPWPEDEPTVVSTSRANRLGIHGVAIWQTDAPQIGEPIFMVGEDGKLTPHRMMWPAFWGRINGDKVTPLLPDEIEAAALGILDAAEQVGATLASMGTGIAAFTELNPDEAPQASPVFLAPGKVYRPNADGGVDVDDYQGTLSVPPTGLWAKEKDGEIVPMVPDFDPNAEQLELIVEDSILTTLEWLAPYEDPRGQPVAMSGTKIYVLDQDLYVQIEDNTENVGDTLEWGWRKDGVISPLVPDFVVRAVTDTGGVDPSLNEEQVARVLTALTQSDTVQAGEYVYVANGKMFRQGDSGEVSASTHEAAEPYAWPLGHNVRPASQSLGARACSDCHAKEAPFYFATIRAQGPLKTDFAAVIEARDLQGEDEIIYVRTAQFFKWLIIITMALLLLHIAMDLARRALNSRAA